MGVILKRLPLLIKIINFIYPWEIFGEKFNVSKKISYLCEKSKLDNLEGHKVVEVISHQFYLLFTLVCRVH